MRALPRGAAIGLANLRARHAPGAGPVAAPFFDRNFQRRPNLTDITARERRYKIGAVVNLIADKYHRGTPDGIYKIASLMPAEGQEYQYRIKDTRTGNVFVVRESQLR
jgi:hypothetical protein